MEAIKTSGLVMNSEHEKASDTNSGDMLELLAKEADARVNRVELELTDLLDCYSKLEAVYKKCQDDLLSVEQAVDGKDRDLTCAQLEVANLHKRIQEIDETYRQSENKLKETLDKLADCNRRYEESARIERDLGIRAASDQIRFTQLETQMQSLSIRAEEAERKIDETVQMIISYEEDLEAAEIKAKNSEMKLFELQKEMRLAGNALRSFEVFAEKTRLAELEFRETISVLQSNLKKAEARALEGEQHVQKLLAEIDKLSTDLQHEQEKLRSISADMEETLSEFK